MKEGKIKTKVWIILKLKTFKLYKILYESEQAYLYLNHLKKL